LLITRLVQSGTRFGRRLLLLFVVCSLLPMTALAVLSYRTITGQLRKGSLNRLEQTGRVLAGNVADHLRDLDDDLRMVTRVSPCTFDTADPACDGSLLYGFLALSFVSESRSSIEFFGRLSPVPAFTEEEHRQLEASQSVALTRIIAGRPRVYLVRRVLDRVGRPGFLIGEVYPTYLWEAPGQNPLIPTLQVHVLDESNRLLFRSTSSAESSPSLGAGSRRPEGTFEWRLGDAPYLAAYSMIRQPPGIATPRWNLVVSESIAAVEAPMAGFRMTFPILALLALAVALVLGLSQIRRLLEPLVALQEGTRRLADHHFDQPVTVAGGDEFGELADSFNAMADQIARQFTALVTAAETDRAVLSSVDSNRIVATVLSRMRDVCRCDRVAVLLMDPGEEASSATLYLESGDPTAEAEARPVRLTKDEAEQLKHGGDGLCVAGGDGPLYLSPLAEQSVDAMLVLPLVYQAELLGAIVLAGRPVGRGEDEQLQARRVAVQVALALANARMVEQIRFLAFYDNLTGLPNRVSFKRRLASELARSGESGRMFGVCFLDLDHFSRINDTLGHKLGDRLLQMVGLQIRSCCQGVDASASVSRLGGDEFTVIIPDLTDPLLAARMARTILDSFNTPFALDGHEVFVSASIGLAIFPTDGADLESLLKNADVAMYQAKHNGRNTFEFFAKSMSTASVKRLTLETQLRKAIDRKEFEIWYQPMVDVHTGRVAGAEALVRWRHPAWGIVLPTEFIAVCEETGLILPLGAWILREVCAQNRAWQEQGLPPIPVGVNLSGQQLRGEGVFELVRDALAEARLDPHHLVLELTESILMENEGGAAAALPALADLGVGLAIDDFGTGYSSLSYLKHFPVDTVKIDKSFVSDVTINPNDAAITSAIIAMGHALDLRVVGEGVETREQAEVLRLQGCDLIQGFWVSRPIPAPAFSAYLREAASAPHRLTLPPSHSRLKRRQARL
jgi:diguanylate cyclase (GGDEF)-like protein